MAETIEQNKRRRGIPENLAGYLEKFRTNLIGTWSNAIEFGPFPSETWEFNPDGTGRCIEASGSGGCTTLFEWREYAPYVILTRETAVQDDYAQEPDEDEDEDSEDEWLARRWIERAFAFKTIEYYFPMVVMYWKAHAPPDDNRLHHACFSYEGRTSAEA